MIVTFLVYKKNNNEYKVCEVLLPVILEDSFFIFFLRYNTSVLEVFMGESK